MTTYGEVVLDARGISKAFPGVKALDRVDLALHAGRSTLLLGKHGAGKSTLMTMLAGVPTSNSGNTLIDYAEMSRATEWLQLLELDALQKTLVKRLQVGQQQIVEIARELAGDVHILIMDEPTSASMQHVTEVPFKRIADTEEAIMHAALPGGTMAA